jgi:hypothetical protein
LIDACRASLKAKSLRVKEAFGGPGKKKACDLARQM